MNTTTVPEMAVTGDARYASPHGAQHAPFAPRHAPQEGEQHVVQQQQHQEEYQEGEANVQHLCHQQCPPSQSAFDHKAMAPTLVAPHLHWGQSLEELHHHAVFGHFPTMRDVMRAPKGEFRRVVERGALQAQLARAAIPTETTHRLAHLGHDLVDAGHAGNLHWILTKQDAVPLADFYDVPPTFDYNAYHFGGFGSRQGGASGGGHHHHHHHGSSGGGNQHGGEVETEGAVVAATAAQGAGWDKEFFPEWEEDPLQDQQKQQHHPPHPQQDDHHHWYHYDDNDTGGTHSSLTSAHCVFLTLRGFDTQDPETDTNQLAVDIANATPEFLPFCVGDGGVAVGGLMVHSGFLKVARALYDEVLEPKVLRNKHPDTKIVLCGHSAGGGTIVALLLLLTFQQGRDYVLQHVLRTYSFAAPQVVRVATPQEVQHHMAAAAATPGSSWSSGTHASFSFSLHPHDGSAASYTADTIPTFLPEDYEFQCPVLATMGLPPSLLYQYVQPWDTAVRLFTSIDPYYHAFEDVGSDGLTLLASSSTRVVQHFLAKALAKWSVWTTFRDLYRTHAAQDYHGVGIQQLLLPHRTSYLAHVHGHWLLPWWTFPRVESMARLDPSELLAVLWNVFPLDSETHLHTWSMVRCFLHHVIPSYVQSFCAYVRNAQDIRHPHDHNESHRDIASPWFPPPEQHATTQYGEHALV